MDDYTRRRVLIGAGAASISSIAGCLGGYGAGGSNGTGDSNTTSSGSGTSSTSGSAKTAQSSFFVFGDFASHVAGDIATANTLVPVGQHGHGWEPGPKIQGTILDSDLFIYGMDGFQPWADDIVTTLREDDADVSLVAAGASVDLLDAGHQHDHNHEGEHHGNESHHEHEGEHHENESKHEHESEHHGNKTHHQREGEHDENESHRDREGHHNHPGGKDPHFWLDPLRAKQAVSNIRQGFVDIDSGNAEVYATNADQYRSRLDKLDSTFQLSLKNKSKEVVFIAGHNAFQYLAERYGFEAETLTDLSPDDQPTPKDIERAQEIISEHDLEYVLADPLESQKAANQLVAETDAKKVLPFTPIPGQTQKWSDKGWGYVEVMKNINLPTLTKALNAQ